uniref:Ground-like domain-containing protein n=1 Tax=Globodera rostochiensis TaxID=31243 RepID=A0A914HHZ1_GLORO
MPAPPQAPPARIPMPSYQIAPPEYSRAVPLPVPIPAKERFSAHEPSKQKSGEDIKDPFEKEAKPSRDESFLPSKYVTGPGSDALLPPIIYPTASAPRQPIVSQQSNSYYQTPTSYQQQQQFQQQQFQQPQDRLPFFPGNSCQCNQPRPSPPQPFAGPQVQMPMQNCCIGCSQRQCSMKMKNKAFGLRTLLNNNNNNSTTANSVEWKDGSGEFEGDEGRCNDAKLRKILKENSSLKMAAAKEIILKRAEKLGKPEKKWRRWGVHVFCAPKDLEYVTRTDRFCSGGVADGVCFAFRTEID